MKIYSFDKTKLNRDINQGNLFNLFQKNIILTPNIPLYYYIVPREYEMRLDRISEHIYGSPNFVEELMVLNDIINPYSVKEGQFIYYCDINNLSALYYLKDEMEDAQLPSPKLVTSSNPNKKQDTYNISNLEQIKVNKDNRVQIINTFE